MALCDYTLDNKNVKVQGEKSSPACPNPKSENQFSLVIINDACKN